MAGYSGRSLADKLGIKPGDRVRTIGAPKDYKRLVSPLPAKATIAATGGRGDLFHLFVRRRTILESELRRLRPSIPEAAPVWVSWPKKASGVETDVTEDVIRAVALPLGFVDVKV